MATTYAVDADITNAEPSAATYIPPGDGGTFDRLRTAAYEDINRCLARRYPPIDAPSDLADTGELTWCEVCGALTELFREAASRGEETDAMVWNYKVWKQRYDTEIESVIVTVSGSTDDTPSDGESVAIFRT